jgi:uncharacterized protein YndB with AHSA1/START domain
MNATEARSVTHSTIVITRNYPAAPQRVFAALADPAKKRRWFAEGEHSHIESFEMDFRVGGTELTRFRSTDGPLPVGTPISNHTTYQDIVPNRRVVLAYTMTVANRPISASLATFELLPVGTGTDLIFTDQAAFFENSDGAQLREEGWRLLLDRLAKELARP